MFWYNYLLRRHWQFLCTQICRYDAICRCNPFQHLVDPMLKVFLLTTELLISSILILFFHSRVENLSIFTTLLELTLPWHYERALHSTRYNCLCQFFIHVCWLDACQYTWIEYRSTILRCKVPNFTPSTYSTYSTLTANVWNIFCFSCTVAVWDMFCFDMARYSIKQVIYWSDEFLNRVPRA